MRWPEPEFPIDEGLVRRLLEDQHPDLAGLALRPFDAGWDNVMWRLGEDLAVRIPRRAIAAPLIVHEQRWLPLLAPGLPLAVPAPLRAGVPASYYPWHWSVVPWIDGEPGDRAPVRDIGGSADSLGRFLRVLHRPAPADAPYNPFRSGSIGSRADTFEERMAKLAPMVDDVALRRVWDTALGAPVHAGAAIWLHGDLHPANTLVRHGAVVAVIDFGDICAGDPACDVGAAWLTVPPEGMDRFWSVYGPLDPALEARSFGWAVLFGLMLLEIGLEGRPTYAEVGRETLDRLASMASGAVG